MSTAELDPISHACRLLREGAAELKNCLTLAATGHDWTGEPAAKAIYDEYMATADALERWADSIGAGGVESLRGRQCLHRISEPAGEYPALPDAAGVVVERVPVGGGWVRHYQGDSYTADQMRAYVDADRAMRAAQPENLRCKSTQKRLATQWGFVPAGAQQPGATTWTPLPGTLPEPGTPVLLDIGKKYPIRAMWAAKHTVQAADDDTDWGEYVEADDMYYAPEGWYEWNECEDNHWHVDKTPVAWCELPPKEQK